MDEVMRLLEEASTKPMPSKLSDLTVPDAYDPPPGFYQPDVHGSFLYSDEHTNDEGLHHVFLPNWYDIASEYPDGRAVVVINRWCRDHCSGPFAWTAASPVWAFRNYEDSLAFKLRWN